MESNFSIYSVLFLLAEMHHTENYLYP